MCAFTNVSFRSKQHKLKPTHDILFQTTFRFTDFDEKPKSRSRWSVCIMCTCVNDRTLVHICVWILKKSNIDSHHSWHMGKSRLAFIQWYGLLIPWLTCCKKKFQTVSVGSQFLVYIHSNSAKIKTVHWDFWFIATTKSFSHLSLTTGTILNPSSNVRKLTVDGVTPDGGTNLDC